VPLAGLLLIFGRDGMKLANSVRTLLFALALAPVAFGCRGGTRPVSADAVELQRVYDMYQHFMRSGKPPHQLSDLANSRYEGISPLAVADLKKGNILVVYDVADKDAGKVLAYKKEALTQGGSVLMADGRMREMTAEELKAAVPSTPSGKK
jgi:hypothetical protein